MVSGSAPRAPLLRRNAEGSRPVEHVGNGASDRSRRRSGLVTSAPDDLDWDDEIRIALEERASMSPDALTGMEATLRFGGTRDDGDAHLRPAHRVAELDFIRPNAVGEGRLKVYGKGGRRSSISSEARCQTIGADVEDSFPPTRALEHWQPNYLDWWAEMGPDGSQPIDVYRARR